MQEKEKVGRWRSRGYLPHFAGHGVAQFVTFRLWNSLPQALLDRWRQELTRVTTSDVDAGLRKRIEAYLDAGYGSAYLKNERVARITQDALLYFDGERYRLAAWVVMPNHVHLLAAPLHGFTLSSIIRF